MSAQVGIKSDCLPTVCRQLRLPAPFQLLIGIDINYSKQCYAYAPLHTRRHTLKQQLCGILLLSSDKEEERGGAGEGSTTGSLVCGQ